jgi:hypothetical protein
MTGNLVSAVVPKGKYKGTHSSRVIDREKGRFDIQTKNGKIGGILCKYVRLLQKATVNLRPLGIPNRI